MQIATPLIPPTPHIPPYQGGRRQACTPQNREEICRNTQAKILYPTEDRERQEIPKQKHSLLQEEATARRSVPATFKKLAGAEDEEEEVGDEE